MLSWKQKLKIDKGIFCYFIYTIFKDESKAKVFT